MARALGTAATAALVGIVVAGCGFDVQSPDLFQLTRYGEGKTVSMAINDGGTIRCDRERAKPISNALLISARDLAVNLTSDAQNNLRIKTPPGSVFQYAIAMQQGTVRFPDVAGSIHKTLAQAELFATQTFQSQCGIGG
jgi:hypothetical protein